MKGYRIPLPLSTQTHEYSNTYSYIGSLYFDFNRRSLSHIFCCACWNVTKSLTAAEENWSLYDFNFLWGGGDFNKINYCKLEPCTWTFWGSGGHLKQSENFFLIPPPPEVFVNAAQSTTVLKIFEWDRPMYVHADIHTDTNARRHTDIPIASIDYSTVYSI